ncbi:MAG: hypothetical protein ACSHWZ_13480 [Sulfitobacter sp.]
MSAILLINPHAAQPQITSFTPVPFSGAQTAQAVAPLVASRATARGDSATGFSGSGAGYGGSEAALPPRKTMLTLTDASPKSVIDAQTTPRTKADPPIFPQDNLPKVEMPDPIPTSPFLLALREAP